MANGHTGKKAKKYPKLHKLKKPRHFCWLHQVNQTFLFGAIAKESYFDQSDVFNTSIKEMRERYEERNGKDKYNELMKKGAELIAKQIPPKILTPKQKLIQRNRNKHI